MSKSTKIVVPSEGGSLEYLDKGDGKAELVGVRARRKPASPGGTPSPGGNGTPSPGGTPDGTPSPGEDMQGLKALDLVAFNSVAEERFVAMLGEMEGWPVRLVRAEAAFRLGVSVETISRYLQKWTAPSAPFVLVGGVVRKR